MYAFKLNSFTLISVSLLVNVICHDLKGFDDSILYSLNWPGVETDVLNSDEYGEKIEVLSSNKEKYECHLPILKSKENTSFLGYSGPTALQLLRPLFFDKICSYRLESYWSYEICHGQYVRQYHEEREGKKVKTQEYFLGKWDRQKYIQLETQMLMSQVLGQKLNRTKIDGVSLPYVEIYMDEGTMCDLNGKPRITRVRYVCFIHGKHEVYSFKETSTCQYEILILSPLLCQHPLYKPEESGRNDITCYAKDGAPKKPRSLLEFEAESQKLRHQSVRLSLNDLDQAKDVLAVVKVHSVDEDGETRLKFEIHSIDDSNTSGSTGTTNQPDRKNKVEAPSNNDMLKNKPAQHIDDNTPVKAFLEGDFCLSGGSGWWKYEFCYGKHVKQYHIDRNGVRTTVLLGTFDPYEHQVWLKQNPHKAPKPKGQRTSLSHFYSHGEMCDKTGKSRQTEVKIKCLDNSSSTTQVSLYLLEPKTCQYVLGVESPLICKILDLAGDDGLIDLTEQFTEDEEKNEIIVKSESYEVKNEDNILDEVQYLV